MRNSELSMTQNNSFSGSHGKGRADAKIHPADDQPDAIDGVTRPIYTRTSLGSTKRDTLTVPRDEMVELQAKLSLFAKAQNTETPADTTTVLIPRKHGKIYKISVFAPEENCGEGRPLTCEFDCIDPDDCETDEGETSYAASVCASPRTEIGLEQTACARDSQEMVACCRDRRDTEHMQRDSEEIWPNLALFVTEDGGDVTKDKEVIQEEKQVVDRGAFEAPTGVATYQPEEAEFQTFEHTSTTMASNTLIMVNNQDEHPTVQDASHASVALTITSPHKDLLRSVSTSPLARTEEDNPQTARSTCKDDSPPHVGENTWKHIVSESFARAPDSMVGSASEKYTYPNVPPTIKSIRLTASAAKLNDFFPDEPETPRSRNRKDEHFETAKPSWTTSGEKNDVTARENVEDVDCVFDAPPVVLTPTRQTVVETKVDALKDELELIRRTLDAMSGTESARALCSASEDRSCQTDLFLLEGLLSRFAKDTVDTAMQTEFCRERDRQSTARSVRFSLPEAELPDHGRRESDVNGDSVKENVAPQVELAPDLTEDLSTKSCEVENNGENGVDDISRYDSCLSECEEWGCATQLFTTPVRHLGPQGGSEQANLFGAKVRHKSLVHSTKTMDEWKSWAASYLPTRSCTPERENGKDLCESDDRSNDEFVKCDEIFVDGNGVELNVDLLKTPGPNADDDREREWVPVWSPEYQRCYYWNPTSDQVTWTQPLEDA